MGTFSVVALQYGQLCGRWRPPPGSAVSLVVKSDPPALDFVIDHRGPAASAKYAGQPCADEYVVRVLLGEEHVNAQDFSVRSFSEGNNRLRPTCQLLLELRRPPAVVQNVTGNPPRVVQHEGNNRLSHSSAGDGEPSERLTASLRGAAAPGGVAVLSAEIDVAAAGALAAALHLDDGADYGPNLKELPAWAHLVPRKFYSVRLRSAITAVLSLATVLELAWAAWSLYHNIAVVRECLDVYVLAPIDGVWLYVSGFHLEYVEALARGLDGLLAWLTDEFYRIFRPLVVLVQSALAYLRGLWVWQHAFAQLGECLSAASAASACLLGGGAALVGAVGGAGFRCLNCALALCAQALGPVRFLVGAVAATLRSLAAVVGAGWCASVQFWCVRIGACWREALAASACLLEVGAKAARILGSLGLWLWQPWRRMWQPICDFIAACWRPVSAASVCLRGGPVAVVGVLGASGRWVLWMVAQPLSASIGTTWELGVELWRKMLDPLHMLIEKLPRRWASHATNSRIAMGSRFVKTAMDGHAKMRKVGRGARPKTRNFSVEGLRARAQSTPTRSSSVDSPRTRARTTTTRSILSLRAWATTTRRILSPRAFFGREGPSEDDAQLLR